MSDRVAVMYAGRIVEIGPLQDVVKSPKHPYTVGLMDSFPRWGGTRPALPHPRGDAQAAGNTAGCPLHPRCRSLRSLSGGAARSWRPWLHRPPAEIRGRLPWLTRSPTRPLPAPKGQGLSGASSRFPGSARSSAACRI
jgi:oligopeptide/dipeptide ABC transporter ATP-binding protein